MEPIDYHTQNRNGSFTTEQIQAEQASFMAKVYGWMAFALVITGITSLYVIQNESIVNLVFGNRLVFFGLIIGELLLVGALSKMVNRVSATTAMAMFIGYSVMNGVTISFIFFVYTMGSIASTFFITAATFAAMSAIGYFTKKDLTSLGNILTMALIGLIIASIVNIFLKSDMLYWIATYAGVLIFTGLTAYDTQKIKEMNIIGNAGTDEDKKEAIMGALTLYLDFINLFLFLLRIFGGRK
ncbi:MAG: Bax inhibitor-1/YccA family protein [Bacteroidetes bacterium]|jgi:FtsH-binding integral membrane protein|nr:Bax inhibitor-1/YccA family protein [Bacteroidota bacterium]MBP7255866.1 Bax inhibitor-1/YccA family protein [Chitinophagales bacterium]MBK7139371.1 Bax inhibitor-1/YccA family protein [Bacteroidota bacterium]MBK7640231.1 Bax inhibitor-1/YccA family protein [Bacteroidota bacterium]MBK8671429.1 Bax inhibitor-1/YccA family protein [Bacteroidota bacterium]